MKKKGRIELFFNVGFALLFIILGFIAFIISDTAINDFKESSINTAQLSGNLLTYMPAFSKIDFTEAKEFAKINSNIKNTNNYFLLTKEFEEYQSQILLSTKEVSGDWCVSQDNQKKDLTRITYITSANQDISTVYLCSLFHFNENKYESRLKEVFE